ncbi:MAG: PAS domain S-box protein [Myxococcales bacterium]|nr:PAS domain S-box protein [Myxococcales bacterium]
MHHDPEITSYLFEHARDIILVIDADDGQILDANRAAEAAYGYTRAELLARKILDLRAEPEGFADQMRLAGEAGIQFETLHRRRDGSPFAVEVSSRGDMMSGRRCLFSIIRDITERKRFEVEREELLIATQRALQLRDDFLMIASHELRAPVTNVSLQLQQLARQIDRGAPRAQLRVMSNAAFHETRRLTSLIDALLDAQQAKGQLALELGDVDLSELIRDVTERLRPRADQVGSEMVVDVPAIRGRWDRLRIDQVVTNLLLNALKYGRGRPVKVAAGEDGAVVRLEVCDQGIGVASEDVQRIWGKFERAVPAHYGGLGLGLFIARQIVEAHQGHVDVESVPGVGSTFRVILPRV